MLISGDGKEIYLRLSAAQKVTKEKNSALRDAIKAGLPYATIDALCNESTKAHHEAMDILDELRPYILSK